MDGQLDSFLVHLRWEGPGLHLPTNFLACLGPPLGLLAALDQWSLEWVMWILRSVNRTWETELELHFYLCPHLLL